MPFMDPVPAGLQRTAPFLPGVDFEKFVPGASPTYEDVVEGRDLVKYDKVPVKVKSYSVEVFDMMDRDDRFRYSSLMERLAGMVQTASAVIYRNELQVLQRGGEGRWFRYVEYAEYELNDPILRRRVRRDSNGDGQVVGSTGVLQEIG